MRTVPILLLALLATASIVVPPSAARGIDDPKCLQIYQRWDLGPVSIVRSGCSTGVEFHGTNCADWKPAWC